MSKLDYVGHTITRRVRVVNESADQVQLLKVASDSVDFYDMDGDMLHLQGVLRCIPHAGGPAL